MKPRKTTRDLLLSFGSQVVFKAIGFATLAILARWLDPEDYGRIMLALAICGVAVLITDLGVCTNLVRKIAARPETGKPDLELALSVRLPLLALYLAGVNLWVAATKPDLVATVLGISVFMGLKHLYRTFSSFFFGLRKVPVTILAFGLGTFVTCLGIGLGAVIGRSHVWAVGSYLVGGLCMLAIAAAAALRCTGRLEVRFSAKAIWRELQGSILLFGWTAMGIVHFSADTLILGYLTPYETVATYEAAARLLEASQFLVRPMTLILFPICAHLAAQAQWSKLTGAVGKLFAVALASGGVAALAVWLLADWIVRIVYSTTYSDAAEVLRVLYLSVPGLYVCTVAGFLAASVHSEKRAFLAMSLGVGLNVVFNFWAIPRYGPLGAAWVTVATQSVVAVWLMADCYKTIKSRRLEAENGG